MDNISLLFVIYQMQFFRFSDKALRGAQSVKDSQKYLCTYNFCTANVAEVVVVTFNALMKINVKRCCTYNTICTIAA